MFDPETFLDAAFTEPNDTQQAQVPAGEYLATIEDVKFVSGQRKDGSGDWLKMTLRWAVQDAALTETYGRQLSAYQDIFLDTNASGSIDMGKGKNVGLGLLRDSVDQNRPGETFTPRALVGRTARVKVIQEIYKDKPLSKVTAVSRQA